MRCTWVPVTQAARWHGSTLERSRSLQTQPTGGRCASVTFILFPVPSHAVEHQVIAVTAIACATQLLAHRQGSSGRRTRHLPSIQHAGQ